MLCGSGRALSSHSSGAAAAAAASSTLDGPTILAALLVGYCLIRFAVSAGRLALCRRGRRCAVWHAEDDECTTWTEDGLMVVPVDKGSHYYVGGLLHGLWARALLILLTLSTNWGQNKKKMEKVESELRRSYESMHCCYF